MPQGEKGGKVEVEVEGGREAEQEGGKVKEWEGGEEESQQAGLGQGWTGTAEAWRNMVSVR